MPFQLTISEGREAGKEFVFDQDSVLIGRSTDCDVALFDPGVSRRHCRIFLDGDAYAVEDQGSANGSLINGSPVKTQVLEDGDKLTLGPVTFIFAMLTDEPATGEEELPAGAQEGDGSTRIVSLDSLKRQRARIRRESPGVVSSAKLFWADASQGVRTGIIGGGVAMVLALFGVLYWLVLSGEDGQPVGEEPSMLTGQPIRDSFGLGPGVTWDRPDMKVFEWEYTAATRAVVILHYQAQSISKDEVVVSVNGVDVGKVPPDTLASQDRSIELMIPAQHLKKGEPNRIIFDNVKNPPGEDPWVIWNIWVERALLPDLLPEELVREATEYHKRGLKHFQTPDIGARNRYEAWKSFRVSWLMLEAHPEPKPDLYYDAQERMKAAQQELDRTCSKLLLEVEGYYNQGNYKSASATLDHVKEYFPEFDQPCATRADAKRAEYGL